MYTTAHPTLANTPDPYAYARAMDLANRRNRNAHCGCTTWHVVANGDGTYRVLGGPMPIVRGGSTGK